MITITTVHPKLAVLMLPNVENWTLTVSDMTAGNVELGVLVIHPTTPATSSTAYIKSAVTMVPFLMTVVMGLVLRTFK